jgi:chaperonin GroES
MHDKTYTGQTAEVEPLNKKAASKELNVKTMLELDNIAEELTEAKRTELSQDVIDGYTDDKASRSNREERMKAAMALAMQQTSEKSDPWDGCANVIVPIITTAAMQFAAKAYPAIINDSVVAKPKVIGSDKGVPQMDELGNPVLDEETGEPVMVGAGEKEAKGKRITDFLNYQLMEKVENWEEDTDRLLNILPVTGNVYRKWHWGDDKPVSGLILPKNFIVDYFTTDLDKARKTQEFVLYPWEIKERVKAEIYLKFDLDASESTTEEADEVVPDTRKEGQSTGDEDSPHVMIEQHVRLDLDNDGYEEPYIATVHIPTKTLVRLRANYEKDGITYTDEKETEILRIKSEVYFVKYGFIPSPDGSFYDLGFGDVLYNLNESINSIVNRLLDAGSLASTSSGFVGRGIKLKGGVQKVKPGEFPVIDTKGGSIRDNFVQIQHPEPSQTLFQLLNMLIDMAKEITFSNQVIEADSAGNMAVGVALQLVEQELTGFKSIHKRVRRSLKKELAILYRMNQLYLDPELYQRVLDTPVGEDFNGVDFDIVPVADSTMLTDTQKIARAQLLDQYKDDPRVDGAKLLEEIFEATGLNTDLILGNPKQQEDPMVEMQRMLTQIEGLKAENAAKALEMKAQKDQQDIELKAAQAQHQARINQEQAANKSQSDQMQLAIKSQEAQMKMQADVHKLQIERAKLDSNDRKSDKEIQKMDAQIVAIYANIELEKQKAQTMAAEKSEKKEEKKSAESTQTAQSGDNSKALAEAVKSLKGDKKSIKLERKKDGSIVGEIK